MLELTKIGKQIAQLRKENGYTGEKLAEILGVSPQAVSKWENGKCLPETALLPRLAEALDCSIDTLLMPTELEYKMEDNEKVRAYYESVNEDARLEIQTKEFVRSKSIISRYLFDNNMEIADIAGGTGPYSFWLAEKGHGVHLLDLTQRHIDIAKQKSKENNIKLASCICADARELPYENESMDLVLLMGALYHLRTKESRIKCLTEAFRVLKPGGHVICTVINRYTALVSTIKFNLFHIFDFETLEKVMKTGMADGFNLPHAYSHTRTEITTELSYVGFGDINVLAVEGIANAFGDNSLPADEREAERLLKCIELTEDIPELIGVSRNIMAVGWKGTGS